MQEFKPIVDIIIPVCKPGDSFAELIKMLEIQTYKARRVIIIITGREYYDESRYEYSGGLLLSYIDFKEFDHGKTRHEGILKSDADYCLLMTQDAVPYDEFLIEKLVLALNKDKVAVAYARQLPDDKCRIIERLTRQFNYPDESAIRTKEDIDKIGIKAFFCSDVCAMYNRKIYLESGGFIRKTIFNEDMIMANTLLKRGYKVYYQSEAKVIHSHNYSNMQQFHRNFDLGVSQADNPQVFNHVSSESEGVKYVKRIVGLLIKEKAAFYIPYFFINSAFRLLGYKLGKNYKKLPGWLVKMCSMNVNYWRQL